jgi:hypothetical protein
MINVSGSRWMMPDPGRMLRFVYSRPRLVRCAFAQHPTVGVSNILQVKSRHADSASLSIRQDREELFSGDIPPNSEIGVTPLTAAELVVSLTLEPRQGSVEARSVVHTFRVRPKVVPPKFAKLEVASHISLGEPLTVIWEAPEANAVTLQIEQGDQRAEHGGASSGAFMLQPAQEGLILLRVIALGTHAKTVETRTVRVKVAKPRMEIERPVQSGAPGTVVTFRWRISGARDAYIEAPERDEIHRVALDGGMTATIESLPEDFHLVAVGLDGRRHTEVLSTVPRLIGCLDET